MKKYMPQIATLAVRLASAAPSPAKLSLAVLFSAMALAIGAQQVSAATVTYIVGTCKSGTQFSTIQSALDASPAPDTVEVCPIRSHSRASSRATVPKCESWQRQ